MVFWKKLGHQNFFWDFLTFKDDKFHEGPENVLELEIDLLTPKNEVYPTEEYLLESIGETMPNLECVDIVTYLETDFYEEQPTPEEMEYYIPFFRVSQRMSNKKSAIFVWNIAHMTHIICLFSDNK